MDLMDGHWQGPYMDRGIAFLAVDHKLLLLVLRS